MSGPAAGDVFHPGAADEATEERVLVDALEWEALQGRVAELGDRLAATPTLASAAGAVAAAVVRDTGTLWLRGICAVVGSAASLLGVICVLLAASGLPIEGVRADAYVALEGWTLAAALAVSGLVCGLPALVALGLEDELVEITRMALDAWGRRRQPVMMSQPSPPPSTYQPPPNWGPR